METLAIVGLIGNVVQFVDFSGKLIAKSTELYRSSEGALAENIDVETATNHLLQSHVRIPAKNKRVESIVPSESRKAVFEVTRRDLSVWDAVAQQWRLPRGRSRSLLV
jgi:Fibronectin type III-like domain